MDRESIMTTDPKAGADAVREALQFYADRGHFMLSDADAWDTVSDEPQNYWCDEAGTATVEDGSVARAALASTAQPSAVWYTNQSGPNVYRDNVIKSAAQGEAVAWISEQASNFLDGEYPVQLWAYPAPDETYCVPLYVHPSKPTGAAT